MKYIALVFFLALGFFGTVASAGAQTDSACPNFSGDQVAAQASFDANGGSASNNFENMDADGNGIACDEPGAFEGGGPTAGPGCEGFNYDQEAAQEYFETFGGSIGTAYIRALDADNNGIACDEAGAFGSGPSAGPGCSQFNGDQQAAQTYFEGNGGNESASTLTRNLDADKNGIACDEPGAFEGGAVVDAGTGETPTDTTTEDTGTEAVDPEGSSSVAVVALPSTGSGPVHAEGDAVLAFAGVSAMLLAGGVLISRKAGRA
jgi:hypothetical protein